MVQYHECRKKLCIKVKSTRETKLLRHINKHFIFMITSKIGQDTWVMNSNYFLMVYQIMNGQEEKESNHSEGLNIN